MKYLQGFTKPPLFQAPTMTISSLEILMINARDIDALQMRLKGGSSAGVGKAMDQRAA